VGKRLFAFERLKLPEIPDRLEHVRRGKEAFRV